jgi:hypothetical protein
MYIISLPWSDFLTKVNGKTGFNLTEKENRPGTQMIPRQMGTGVRMYGYDTRRKLSFSLGQYTTVLQTGLHAIKACAVENIDRGYENKNIRQLGRT